MFRRLPGSLPSDYKAPADLRELGCLVNGNDQIRLLSNPNSSYAYKVDRNDRVNQLRLAAINKYTRNIIHNGLLEAGLEILRLPIETHQSDPHVPVYVSGDIKQKRRVIILFGQRNFEPGIFSYKASRDDGIKRNSAVDLASFIANDSAMRIPTDTESPGFVIANPHQLIWYRGDARAIGDVEWQDLPRASAVHQAFRIDPLANRTPGNRTYEEHVRYIFEHVMSQYLHPQARFDIIGLEYTGTEVMRYIATHWEYWSTRINGICLGNPQHTIQELQTLSNDNAEFLSFIKKKVRAYFVSDESLETPIHGIERTGCNCYSSGEAHYEERIIIRAWRNMLAWFNIIHTVKEYEEPRIIVVDAQEENQNGTEDAVDIEQSTIR